MKNKLRSIYHQYFQKYFQQIYEIQQDTLAMQSLAPFSQTYLPWSDSSMRPTALVAVLNDILINKRVSIVECGGGISTLYIARLLKEKGGKLYTLEHEKKWANFLEEQLKDEALDKFVSIIASPLISTHLAIDNNQWYDTNILSQFFSNQSIDMLLVDGPPAYKKQLKCARYPAVPYFKPFLADDYTIILDDINREGEQKVLIKWEEDLNISFERRLAKGNIAIGRSKSLFTV